METNKILSYMMNITQHYNHQKYWKMRKQVVDKDSKINPLLRLYYLFRIKRMDAFNGASFGTHFKYGASFDQPPILPHGLRGIFVSHHAKIGKNCTIFHQVTIGDGKDGAPSIGDNVYIGAGAKLTGKINIGDNVRIGTNCSIARDIGDNCTVVSAQPRVIQREG